MKFLVADDHPMFCDAISGILESSFENVEIVLAHSLDTLQEAVDANQKVDVALLDLSMPGVYGFSGLSFLKGSYPETPIAIISAREEPAVINKAKAFGACGYIPKSASVEVLTEALAAVAKGEGWFPEGAADGQVDEEDRLAVERLSEFSTKQFKVFLLMADGYSNQQIADKLFMSISTAKGYVSATINALELTSRTQVALVAKRLESKGAIDLKEHVASS